MQFRTAQPRVGKALIIGGLSAIGWYSVCSALLGGLPGSVISVTGAIAIAGLIPAYWVRNRSDRHYQTSLMSMVQQAEAINLHAAINIVDTEHNITEVNDRLLELTGYTREQLIGKPVDMLYEEVGLAAAVDIREHLKRGETWQGETPLRHAAGHMVVAQATVMPLADDKNNWIGSVTVRTGVTGAHEYIARQDTVQTLHELRDDIWIVDAETERFSYLNGAAAQRLKLDRSTYLVKTLGDLNQGKRIDSIINACRILRKNRDGTTNFEMQFDDVPFHVTVKFLPNTAQSGRYLILLSDISEKVMEERRKAEFISTVSHELRSPLTSIKGSMGLLLSKSAGELPAKAISLLEISHRNADRLVLILNDMLDLEKIAQGQLEFDNKDVDLCELVHETVEANIPFQQRTSQKFEITGDEVPRVIRTDPNRVIQVLNNFLSNASKFSRPGGKIVISLYDDADHVRICVKDEGPGISPEDQQKVFQRFADMSNSDRVAKGGTGLGLSICKAIVEGLDGTIGFETKVGLGTTFYFSLPKPVQKPVASGEFPALSAAG